MNKRILITNGIALGVMAYFFKNDTLATASIILFNIGLSVK
jgi:hypothetical protein